MVIGCFVDFFGFLGILVDVPGTSEGGFGLLRARMMNVDDGDDDDDDDDDDNKRNEKEWNG